MTRLKYYFFFFLFNNLIIINSYSQFTTDQVTFGDRIDLENSNSWSLGTGLSNFIMHGDLRSIGTGDDVNYYNFGSYIYM